MKFYEYIVTTCLPFTKINCFPNNACFSYVGAVGANGFVEKLIEKRKTAPEEQRTSWF